MMESAPLMLSVSGARGIVGRSMTEDVATRFAAAFASLIRESAAAAEPLILVGRDSRTSGEALAAAAMRALMAAGCRVIDLGVAATPSIGVMVDHRSADGAIIITASHNPIQWNGIKCLGADGAALPAEPITEVIERFRGASSRDAPAERGDRRHPPSFAGGGEGEGGTASSKQHPASTNPANPSLEARGSSDTSETGDPSATVIHVQRVLSTIDPAPIRAARMKVVLDSVCGAGGPAGAMLLKELGCVVVHMNAEPTGGFPHPPEPLEKNLRDLAQRVGAEKAACGFAQDPDADRLAIIDETSRYIGEEYTLALAVKRILEQRGPGVIAANLSTSRMIDDIAAAHPGSRIVRTAVGEANVVAAMRQSNAVIGGEGNGGVILPEVCRVRDSLSAMALVLGLLAADGRPLSAVVDDLPRYAMIKRALDLSEIGGRDAIAPALQRVAAAFSDAPINTTDGVRIDLRRGWVHLRPSNTEPIIRLIAEASDEAAAAALIEEAASAAGLASALHG